MCLNKFRKLKFFSFVTVAILLLSLGMSDGAQAADLRLVPSNSRVEVSDNFSVAVQLASPKQSANAVYGVINFPPNLLQVVSVNHTGSVVDLWVQDPAFSNMSGQVIFEGAILNPGFTGESGRVLTVNFRAKADGVAKLAFAGGSVLANDGQGTNILNQLSPATVTVTAKTVAPAAPKPASTSLVESPAGDTIPPVLTVNEVKLSADGCSLLIDWGKSLVVVLSVVVPLVGLILLLLIVSLSGWRRLILLKLKLRREVSDAEIKLTETFEMIKANLQEQLELLEKAKKRRALTVVENKLLRTIKNDLDEATKILKKEIKDIEDEIK
ncbi:MAG: hypothetical protein COV08_01315 [Candidatus Vogelbacteria bacterium CG10_big_fil_rev_8_21_14_0_10_49_38]|uniref:Cohesin domain-containing protein n=1 Tax=Candidatus Vogelbacteria bacterium CG10_big_fil_rev_8_21_14_0_10_49_38 TaxID=1975043 RepID=A0A2H0RHV3_9BACT|nr:MAG: hypothetical protein BK006_01335 [bacterium CG10_49_38]PIR46131.1 MAG: hypothetical protein COV08_01315 [Candidatus Vogelbacteria bacterium CG10_big_fil_rev_8_21_14_0_10_49_38]